MKTLTDLYKTHVGKVSDKWTLYLREYDRIFNPYRNQSISMLEIGIQNGGSLEIWSQYFPHAEKIIGCDINPDCGNLRYDDPRVVVIVGDANLVETQEKIINHSASFDLIIDDGSHTSGDIVKAFANYFPTLNEGGLFVVEDLHCSYWKEFEGGIFYPYSSINFFKLLADVVNHESWGVPRTREQFISGFKKRFELEISEDLLSQIHSVEFINSVCIVKKLNSEMNLLGDRFVAGVEEQIVFGHLPISGTKNSTPEQSANYWSSLTSAPAESHLELVEETKQLRHSLGEEQAALKRLRSCLEEEKVKSELLKTEVSNLKQVVDLMKASTSWRMTAPMRAAKRFFIQDKAPLAPNHNAHVMQECKEMEQKTEVPEYSAAFDALSGISPTENGSFISEDISKLIAFYLPQYHRVPENSEWWGPGFTEWTNVVKGRPNYDGHYQPHLPRELGFYDLSNVEVMREQAELAKLYGVEAFCFYYYWFSGSRILERPINNFLASDINIDYCLCWANENWTRTWDGDTRSILMEQKYRDEDPINFILSLLPHFKDRRYIRVNGKPLLVVYRAKDIPNVSVVFNSWREIVSKEGFPGLHIAVVDFYDIERPDEVGGDALVEFPPHKFNGPQTVPNEVPNFTNPNFRGGVVDYAKVVAQSANRVEPDFTLYRAVIPSWDNTARRQDTPTILHGSTPVLFKEWLLYVRAYTRKVFKDKCDKFIFINAWNEWGEGCHLEPDQKHGLAYLEAVKGSSWFDEGKDQLDLARERILSKAAFSISERTSCGFSSGSSVNLMREIAQVKPPKPIVQKIAYALRKYPLIYKLGKRTYRLSRLIFRA